VDNQYHGEKLQEGQEHPDRKSMKIDDDDDDDGDDGRTERAPPVDGQRARGPRKGGVLSR